MSWILLLWMWRIPLAVVFSVGAWLLVTMAGATSLPIPLADAPRYLRQAVNVALPALLSILLVSPLPDIHDSLVRDRFFHRVTRTAFWILLAIVFIGGWITTQTPRNLVLFEVFTGGLLVLVAMLWVPRFGVNAVLGMTIAGCFWLIYGPLVGEWLGFGDLMTDEAWVYTRPAEQQAWFLTVGVVVIALFSTVIRPSSPQ